jgi:N-acetylmuramidase
MVTRTTRKPASSGAAVKKTTPARKAAVKAPAKAAVKAKPPSAPKPAPKPAPKVAAKPKSSSAARPAKTLPAKAAARPAAKPAPGRSRASSDELDPARQLDKLDADPPARSRSATRGPVAAVQPVVPGLPDDFFASYTGESLGDEAMLAAAQDLGCELAAIKAVAEVESRGAGFDSTGRPTVLYERQVFSRQCTPKGRFDSMPDISAPVGYGRGNYGNTESQWQKIAKAYALDPVAALKAPSWGIFQVLGENHRACGYEHVADFVRLMVTSQVGHLQAFVSFIKANPSLLKAIRARDWATFARWYNGKDYATYQYDEKMAAAYARHAAGQ